MRLLWHKITHWEYWPYQVLYVPIYFVGLYYAIRARSFFFFNACNPSIKNGGYINESKRQIYDLIPQKYYPQTVFVPNGSAFEQAVQLMEWGAINYPCIAKPDMGLRGQAVQKIDGAAQLAAYHRKAGFDYLLQAFIPYPREVGIFYVRRPGNISGRITGIVGKEFLTVIGDGKSRLRDLLQREKRFAMQLHALEKNNELNLDEVLSLQEKRTLVPYGNHARGAKFLDCSHWISPELEVAINVMCQEIPGFYFGRLDVMYASEAELKAGKSFQIVELNGAGSEPTHIYDPRHSVFFAWKELARHLGYMFEISVANHQKGAPYLTFRQGMAEFAEHRAQCAKIFDF